jgi:hypothetical protein
VPFGQEPLKFLITRPLLLRLVQGGAGAGRRITDSNRFSSFFQSDPKASHHFRCKGLAGASATASIKKVAT